MDGCIDRRHDHPSDQIPPSWGINPSHEEVGRRVDKLGPRSIEFDIDLVGARSSMHHEEVQLVEIMLIDEEVDDLPDDDLETGVGVHVTQQFGEPCGRSLDVPLGERDEQGVLVGEVLVEGPDGDAGLVGDVVGGGPGISLLVENASSGIEDAFDRAARPLLEREFAR